MKSTQNKELLLLSLVILMTVVAWIIVDLYHIQNNTNFIVDYKKSQDIEIKPLNAASLIDKLQKRQ